MIQIGGWVIITLLFECIVLIPIALYFRATKHFRFRVFLVGFIAWLLFSLAWFYTVFGMPLTEAVIILLPMGISGAVICATFASLWGRAQHA